MARREKAAAGEAARGPVIRDRIVELRRVPARELAAHARNWREHPDEQRTAMRAVLEEIGYAGAVLARQADDGALHLIDGHLRTETTPDALIPVLVLDVTAEEAEKLLATVDPLAALARPNPEILSPLLRDLQARGDTLVKLVWPDYMLEPLLAVDWTPVAVDPDAHPAVPPKSHDIAFTPEQWAVVERAIARVRGAAQDGDVSQGRAVELICADYLAGE